MSCPGHAAEDEVAEALAGAGSLLTVPAGTLLFGQGDAADRFFLLHDGRVRLFVGDPAGGEAVLHVFQAGDMFGLPAMVGLHRYPVNGEAMTECRLTVVTRPALLDRLKAEPERLMALFATLGGRWRLMARQLAELKARSPLQRLCGWLVRTAERVAPEAADGPVDMPLEVQHYVIAGAVGMAPENLSRAFQRLRPHGVEVGRRRIRIESLSRLKRLCHGAESAMRID